MPKRRREAVKMRHERSPARPMIRFVIAIALACAAPVATSQAVQKAPRIGVLCIRMPQSVLLRADRVIE